MKNPLYAKLYPIPVFPRLSRFLLNNLRWRGSVLRTLPPTFIGAESIQNDYIMYTDASFGNGKGGIADVLIDSLRMAPSVFLRAD